MYRLMHKDTRVCDVYLDNKIHVYNWDKLPYGLRDKSNILTVRMFDKWLSRRIDNISRTNMNKVYILRGVGRDEKKILEDSYALSITDLFWLTTDSDSVTWYNIKETLDTNLDVFNTALSGKISTNPFSKSKEDTTSLFTLKGVFPKAIHNGKMYKTGNNVRYELAAYNLGKILGISIVNVKGNLERVEIDLFTNHNLSLVHAAELMNLIGCDNSDEVYRYLYNYFQVVGKYSICLELELLYLFRYLIADCDLHSENFGFLYDTSTFDIISLSPSFDHNAAFELLPDEYKTVYYEWILNNLSVFAKRNTNFIDTLKSNKFISGEWAKDLLTADELNQVNIRAEFLLKTVER